MTGITVSARCAIGQIPDSILALVDLQAASGTTMDAFTPSGSTIGGTSVSAFLAGEAATSEPSPGGVTNAVATSNDAVATIEVGGTADWPSQTCTFLWQAVEKGN